MADIYIGIENDELKDFFNDYLSTNKPELTISVNKTDIENEKTKSIYKYKDFEYLKLAVYRKISDELPRFNAFLIHGSSLFIEGSNACLLSGQSGVGKSTHAKLLRKFYNATMINDDKPIIRIINDIPYIYGTPYDGKHHLSNNVSKRLENIIFIEQCKTNSIELINKDDAFILIYNQSYKPFCKQTLALTIDCVNKLNINVNTYRLKCDISKDAAELSYKILK